MAGHGGLAYARYLFQRRQPTDADVDFTLLGLSCLGREGCGLTLMALPGASNTYDQAGWADLRAGGPDAFDPDPWQEMVRGPTWLYRNPEAMARVSLVPGAITLNAESALDALADGSVDPRQEVIIEEAAKDTRAGNDAGQPGRISAVDYGSQRIAVDTELWDGGRLLISDLYYPGWRARVDDKEERIERADYCLRSVPLGPGPHQILLTYVPASFRLGLWTMVGTLMAMAGMALGIRASGLVAQKLKAPQGRPSLTQSESPG